MKVLDKRASVKWVGPHRWATASLVIRPLPRRGKHHRLRAERGRNPRRHDINAAYQAGRANLGRHHTHPLLLCAWLAGNGVEVGPQHRRMLSQELSHLVFLRWTELEISKAILGQSLTSYDTQSFTPPRALLTPFPIDIHPGLAE